MEGEKMVNANTICYNCKQTEHLARNCPFPPLEPRCDYCLKVNKHSTTCRRRFEKVDKPFQPLLLKITFGEVKPNVIWGKRNDQSFTLAFSNELFPVIDEKGTKIEISRAELVVKRTDKMTPIVFEGEFVLTISNSQMRLPERYIVANHNLMISTNKSVISQYDTKDTLKLKGEVANSGTLTIEYKGDEFIIEKKGGNYRLLPSLEWNENMKTDVIEKQLIQWSDDESTIGQCGAIEHPPMDMFANNDTEEAKTDPVEGNEDVVTIEDVEENGMEKEPGVNDQWKEMLTEWLDKLGVEKFQVK